MERCRVEYRTALGIHGSKCSRCRVHISCTEIVQSCRVVLLLAVVEIAVFGVARPFEHIAECVVVIGISELAISVDKSSYAAVSVIQMNVRRTAALHRDKVCADSIVAELPAVLVCLCKYKVYFILPYFLSFVKKKERTRESPLKVIIL